MIKKHIQKSNLKLTIHFDSLLDTDALNNAAKEYQAIWQKGGNRIVKIMEQISSLHFLESHIEVFVYYDRSYAGKNIHMPLLLCAYNSPDRKKAMLIHELGHRLLLNLDLSKTKFLGHQVLFLILYDIWTELYGKKFADAQVKYDSNLKSTFINYKKIWSLILKSSKKERIQLFTSIVKQALKTTSTNKKITKTSKN